MLTVKCSIMFNKMLVILYDVQNKHLSSPTISTLFQYRFVSLHKNQLFQFSRKNWPMPLSKTASSIQSIQK